MKAIRVHEPGGVEALKYEDVESPRPGAAEALIDIRAAGVNFIDIYHRQGIYKLHLPFIPGMEAAGIVKEVGEAVSEVKSGDRVAYAMSPGAYAEQAVVPVWKLVKLPSDLNFQEGAAALLQGMTAHYLTHGSYHLKAGETALVHAAAGGVGLLLVQMAKLLKAQVIGTVSTEEKAELARQAGADHVILYTKKDFESEVKRLTDGRGVEVVYESVGKETFERSLNCLKPRGYLILYGQSSGPVEPFDPQILSQKGSLFLTRPTLAHYASNRHELLNRAGDVLTWISEGKLRLRIGHTYPLAQARQAHSDLEGRRTTGKVLLLTADR
ncbi:MAG: quinone oxidoreductase family protein [Acidobacteriota bacterium]